MSEGSAEKIIKWVTFFLPILVVLVGLGINWGVTKTELSDVKYRMEELRNKRNKLQSDVHELQLKQASETQILENIRSNLKEIKIDIKDLKKLILNIQ